MKIIEVSTQRTPAIPSLAIAKGLRAAHVGSIGSNFKKFFLDIVEVKKYSAALTVYQLEGTSKDRIFDKDIIKFLGNRAVVSLSRVCKLLQKQALGEKGVLVCNGAGNITYALGLDWNVWAIYFFWSSDRVGWTIEAFKLEDSLGWSAGHRVLARTF